MKINILKILFILLATIVFSSNIKADSPITSIEIWRAYENEPIILKSSKSNGKLNEPLFEYIIDNKNPIAIKVAIINKLSWDFSGKTNSQKFIKFLKKKKLYSSKEDFIKNGEADELLSFAYLLAMDNYFNVNEAIAISEMALQKNPESYTFNIIDAIIKAQSAMDGRRSVIFNYFDSVRENEELTIDMNEKAISLIFGYMDLYKKYSTLGKG